ncbi:YgfZ/GcvT domain-containing protein [Halomonas beimenensis]|uniref:Folate-dependent protein for Fe/S cluster synthesis/repair in oxidative stress n=1 Tax=Halomonas beimenensis TaxID=475662 RepID=A0A291P7M1_9GAMM|nr:folate-binding protein YgfZ [Halomonas beimenensis]ATJ82870.1 folate-dependent protein for Fe/S cluster synthesis/repair in oxidative stress [Halomonas beimenensis]
MTDWIARLGGRREHDDRVAFDTPEPARRAMDATVMTPLIHLGVLDVEGEDAKRFLQGQTSAQVSLADGDFAPLTCFCTPKGRVLANAQLWRVAEGRYRLLMHRSLVTRLHDHLKKFAAFYKAELTPRPDLALLGLIGREAPAVAEVRLDAMPPAVWHQAEGDDLQLLAHPGPRSRLLACLPVERVAAVWEALAAQAEPVGNAVWCLHDIQAGLAWLTADQADAYLPQMLNWEALGGISFKKGCYTGQEVVARAHFRGQVKKRLVRGQLDGALLPEPGSAIEDADDRRLGEVLSAELDAYDQAEVLAVIGTREPVEPLRVAGQKLKRLQLPYPLERVDPETLAAKA